ncbi:MAG: hypothetical protein J5734_02300 [Prevotella sp.]|nr:hypothetical protein [Prevotella sp.]MBR5729088.1 hypothetical protein [Prevotella sp.]
MKKVMMMAVAAFFAVSASAQNPDAVKQIMGMKDFKEAKALVESSLSSMSNEEKAKVWNKVVDLAYSKYDKESTIQITNQAMQKNDPFDKQGMFEAARTAVEAAFECEKYDQLPNEKGKVKPKFHKNNQTRMASARNALVNLGQELYENRDFKGAADVFGIYVDCKNNPLFSDYDFSKDNILGQVAYFASLSAYNAQDYPRASSYADLAVGDTAVAKDAMDIKIFAMKAQLKTKADSLKYLSEIKELYTKDPTDERMFTLLTDYYQASGESALKNELINNQVAKYPSKMAYALKGESEMGDNKWADAIESYKKTLTYDPEFLQVIFNLALCQNNQAITLKDAAAGALTAPAKALLQESIKNLNLIKEKDPDHLTYKWPYFLYQAYYLIGDEANAKALESLVQ